MSDDQSLPLHHVRAFVIAGHGDLPKVQAMLADCPTLLNAAYPWKENDLETAIQGAAHVGNVAVAEYLLAQGAALEICTAAMLGREKDVERLLIADPELIQTTGAHGIPLLAHAAFSGDLGLFQRLFQRGAQAGLSQAFYNAATKGHAAIVRWCLENGEPDVNWRNFQGQTALKVARERNLEDIVQLLQAQGATE